MFTLSEIQRINEKGLCIVCKFDTLGHKQILFIALKLSESRLQIPFLCCEGYKWYWIQLFPSLLNVQIIPCMSFWKPFWVKLWLFSPMYFIEWCHQKALFDRDLYRLYYSLSFFSFSHFLHEHETYAGVMGTPTINKSFFLGYSIRTPSLT